jgi:hypothetical protein
MLPMPGNETDTPQGPFEGSRCVAGPGGQWGPATIRWVNEDGSFRVEFDVKEMVVMPYWYGLTPAEISFDDARQWSPVFAQISPDRRSFAWKNFPDALAALGYQVLPDQARQLWDQGCQKLFNASEGQTASRVLDETWSYRLFLQMGVSAKQCAENLKPDRTKPYFKLYWNQTRMGGREPAEISRQVTLADALAALGLTSGRVEKSTAAFLERFERKHSVRLPATLVELLQRAGVADAVQHCHPNNPSLVEFMAGWWDLRRGMRGQQLSGDYALVIMVPHQGDHEWAVVFDDGEDDARIYLRWDTEGGEAWLLTAPGVGMFFWDLAQTGLAWYQDTRFQGGKPAKCSDIGLILDS